MCPSHEYSRMLATVRDAKVVRLSPKLVLMKRQICSREICVNDSLFVAFGGESRRSEQ